MSKKNYYLCKKINNSMRTLSEAQRKAQRALALKKQQDSLKQQKASASTRNLNFPLSHTPNIG
jgi:uncharacterized protein YaaN involved in tellurite resistance